jgi:hypothetical protein
MALRKTISFCLQNPLNVPEGTIKSCFMEKSMLVNDHTLKNSTNSREPERYEKSWNCSYSFRNTVGRKKGLKRRDDLVAIVFSYSSQDSEEGTFEIDASQFPYDVVASHPTFVEDIRCSAYSLLKTRIFLRKSGDSAEPDDFADSNSSKPSYPI